MSSSGAIQREDMVPLLHFGKFQYVVDYCSKRLKAFIVTWFSSVCLFCGYSNTRFRHT